MFLIKGVDNFYHYVHYLALCVDQSIATAQLLYNALHHHTPF